MKLTTPERIPILNQHSRVVFICLREDIFLELI